MVEHPLSWLKWPESSNDPNPPIPLYKEWDYDERFGEHRYMQIAVAVTSDGDLHNAPAITELGRVYESLVGLPPNYWVVWITPAQAIRSVEESWPWDVTCRWPRKWQICGHAATAQDARREVETVVALLEHNSKAPQPVEQIGDQVRTVNAALMGLIKPVLMFAGGTIGLSTLLFVLHKTSFDAVLLMQAAPFVVAVLLLAWIGRGR